jgi:hypothetical protein
MRTVSEDMRALAYIYTEIYKDDKNSSRRAFALKREPIEPLVLPERENVS